MTVQRAKDKTRGNGRQGTFNTDIKERDGCETLNDARLILP